MRKVARAAHPGGSDEIKVALIGCGGRGTGAAVQALATKGKVTLWAAADAFADNMQASIAKIKRDVERGKRDGDPLYKDSHVDVPAERQFDGFDAYKKAIDSGADLVILATPPGFRPMHFEAAVEAGKHIFMEKPVAVDAPGVRRVLAANEKAKKKNLKVARRPAAPPRPALHRNDEAHPGRRDRRHRAHARLLEQRRRLGARPRKPEQTEMEYQMRNWYYFNWLCGDHIVEQHIHNLDVGNWIHGATPVEAQGMGGRQVRTGKEYGEIFDHHAVEFTYADGTKMFSQCRHIEGCDSEVREHAHGTKGTLDIDDGAGGLVATKDGKWRSKEQEGQQSPPGASRLVRRAPRWPDLQRSAIRRRIDDDGNPGPDGDLLRQDDQMGRSAAKGHRSVAAELRFRCHAAGRAR